jgi:nucleoside-diphosphate kinase
MEHTTLLLIKPNATAKNQIGEILRMVEAHGFVIDNLKLFRFDTDLAEQFYDIHQGKPFFQRLIDFMTSGKTVAVVLHRNDAVAMLRKLVGDTDHTKAAPGTIRFLFGETITVNAVHASDSPENAAREIALIFSDKHNK